MITKSCWKGSCKIIEVIQSEVFLVDVYSLARSLADAYKVKSGEELPYQSLEVMLFYAWWYSLEAEHCELFYMDWKLSYGRLILADECVEEKLKKFLSSKGGADLSCDAQNFFDWLCNS